MYKCYTSAYIYIYIYPCNMRVKIMSFPPTKKNNGLAQRLDLPYKSASVGMLSGHSHFFPKKKRNWRENWATVLRGREEFKNSNGRRFSTTNLVCEDDQDIKTFHSTQQSCLERLPQSRILPERQRIRCNMSHVCQPCFYLFSAKNALWKVYTNLIKHPSP